MFIYQISLDDLEGLAETNQVTDWIAIARSEKELETRLGFVLDEVTIQKLGVVTADLAEDTWAQEPRILLRASDW